VSGFDLLDVIQADGTDNVTPTEAAPLAQPADPVVKL
jgi:hypothetical protein